MRAQGLADELMELKTHIGELDADKHRLEGQMADRTGRLTKEFGCNTVQQADRKLASLRTELEKADAEVEDKMDDLSRRLGVG